MTNQRKTELTLYRICDWLSAAMAWFLFFFYRRKIVQPDVQLSEVISDEKLILGILVIPLGWIIIYSIFDKYSDIYRYSRLATIRRTFILSIIGSLFLFFTILVDDATLNYTSYLKPFVVLFALHFIITTVSRLILLTWAKWRLKKGKVKYDTLLIGGGSTALKLHDEITSSKNILGLHFMGFVEANASNESLLSHKMSMLGNISDIEMIIDERNVEEVVVALDESDHSQVSSILNTLYDYRESTLVKIVPSLYDALLGKVKMNHIYNAGLIEIDQQLMPRHEQVIKRLVDILAAIVLIIICAPLYLFIAIKVRLSSTGPLLFKQERIGRNGRPFSILKFRSMYTDAEKAGPQLSSDHDPRITPFGRVMRKWRLDEIPQFFNLLFGDMSLVGPRPERQFYIDKIIAKEPLYKHLLQVRPGITSWGQVKFGYASDVDQMVQRMKYDLIYLENMSVSLDIKILFHTFLILLQGKGK